MLQNVRGRKKGFQLEQYEENCCDEGSRIEISICHTFNHFIEKLDELYWYIDLLETI